MIRGWKIYSVLIGFAIVVICAGGCYKAQYSEDEDVSLPSMVKLSDADYEKYLYETNPDIKSELADMEKDLKKELGVTDIAVPPPPPGWNLEDSLLKDDSRPKVYRWLDESGSFQITRYPPPKGIKLLGWRYADIPTPTPTDEEQEAVDADISPDINAGTSARQP